MTCEICHKQFSSNKGLSTHISHIHKLTIKQYYDKYLKSDTEGKCMNCGQDVTFRSLSKGYRLFCSRTCCNTSLYHQNKMQNTIISRYGGMGTSSEIINNKIKDTNIKKYGAENVYASEHGKSKIIQTSLKRYGTKWPSQSEVIKNKIKQTSLIRYGTTNPGNGRFSRQKAAMTRRGSYNDSSWEDYFEEQCKKHNIIYKRRYDLDSRYPFQCDFYFPNKDMFIEINGYWSHGGHFFDNTNLKDIETLNKWKEKAKNGHKQYQNAIIVWTDRDLRKREYAVKNNLNYVILWTYEDIINFFKNEENLK